MVVKSENVYFDGKQDLRCDECGSLDINSDSGEYVCKTCGLVLDIQKLEYHRPYKDEKIQRSVLTKSSTTQIGFRRERMNSSKLQRLHNMQRSKDSTQIASENIHKELKRIISHLDLSIDLSNVEKKVILVRNYLESGTKYRNPEKLVPIVLYVAAKVNNVAINKKRLLEVAKVDKKDFHAFLTTVLQFFPHYDEESKRKYILQKVMKITEEFDLGMQFYFLSKNILTKLWNVIKNTKEDVVAGVVSSVATLCKYRDLVSVNALCKQLNIRMSTIQFQVENRIFKPTRTPGFTTLVKSADLLTQIMKKLGILVNNTDNEVQENKEMKNNQDVRETTRESKGGEGYPKIVLVKIRELTNKYLNRYSDKYLVAIKDPSKSNTPLLFTIPIGHSSIPQVHSEGELRVNSVLIPENEYIKIKLGIGPP